MPRYEYKVVPAPTKGLKAKGVKGAEARFAHAVQELMNGLTGYGWEYLRAETLPSIERAGLTGTTTEWRNVLVFRRVRESDADAYQPELLPAPAVAAAGAVAAAADAPSEGGQHAETEADNEPFEPPVQEATTTLQEAWDNGVEDTDDVEDISSSLESLSEARKSDKSED